MNMKIALNEGTLKFLPLDKVLQLALDVGYFGFGVWMAGIDDLVKNGNTLDDVCHLIKNSGLEIVELDFLKDWIFAEGENKKHILKEAEHMCQIAKNIGAHCICAAAFGNEGTIEMAVQNFKDLCDLAKFYDVKVALEFLPWQKINSILLAFDIVEKANRENGGILIDTFHFYKGPSMIEHIDKVPVDKIFLVHLSDLPSLDDKMELTVQTRNYRVFPGNGNFDLKSFITKLKEKKYNGYFSLEILNKDFKDEDPKTIAQLGKSSLNNLDMFWSI